MSRRIPLFEQQHAMVNRSLTYIYQKHVFISLNYFLSRSFRRKMGDKSTDVTMNQSNGNTIPKNRTGSESSALRSLKYFQSRTIEPPRNISGDGWGESPRVTPSDGLREIEQNTTDLQTTTQCQSQTPKTNEDSSVTYDFTNENNHVDQSECNDDSYDSVLMRNSALYTLPTKREKKLDSGLMIENAAYQSFD